MHLACRRVTRCASPSSPTGESSRADETRMPEGAASALYEPACAPMLGAELTWPVTPYAGQRCRAPTRGASAQSWERGRTPLRGRPGSVTRRRTHSQIAPLDGRPRLSPRRAYTLVASPAWTSAASGAPTGGAREEKSRMPRTLRTRSLSSLVGWSAVWLAFSRWRRSSRGSARLGGVMLARKHSRPWRKLRLLLRFCLYRATCAVETCISNSLPLHLPPDVVLDLRRTVSTDIC